MKHFLRSGFILEVVPPNTSDTRYYYFRTLNGAVGGALNCNRIGRPEHINTTQRLQVWVTPPTPFFNREHKWYKENFNRVEAMSRHESLEMLASALHVGLENRRKKTMVELSRGKRDIYLKQEFPLVDL